MAVLSNRFSGVLLHQPKQVQLAAQVTPAGAPAGGTADVSSHAGTIYLVHTRSTCFADS